MELKLMIIGSVFSTVASGRLPTIALTLLVSDVLLDTSFDPSTLAPPPADRLLEILQGEEEKFQQTQRQGSGRSIKVGPAAEEEAMLLQGGQRRPPRDWVNVDGEAGNFEDALDGLTQTVGGIFGGVSSMFMNPFSIFGKGKASSTASSPVGSPISGNVEEVSPQKEAKESDCPSTPLTSDAIFNFNSVLTMTCHALVRFMAQNFPLASRRNRFCLCVRID
jgi:hypothetical protein